MAARARALVHPRLDGWLLGGLGVVAWLVVRQLGSTTAPITGIVSGAFLTTAAMHFGASYHLAYGDGLRSLRRHPLALVAVPLVLVAAAVAVVVGQAGGQSAASAWLLRALLVTVFTLTGWHYVKQAYGVGMLSARARGMRPSPREVLVLRYGLYPVWLYDVLEIYGRGRNASYGGYDVTVGIVPAAWQPIGQAVAVLSLGAALVVMVRLAVRARSAPPLGLVGAYVTGGLWFIAPPGYVSAALVLAGIHGIQYLTCAHRAEVDLAVERREPHLVHRWLCVFGGAAAGGLLLTTWLPEVGDANFASADLPNMVGVLVFAFFNLHHYAVDAVIWRSGGDHVVRMSKGPRPVPVEVAPTAEPVPSSAGHPVPSLA